MYIHPMRRGLPPASSVLSACTLVLVAALLGGCAFAPDTSRSIAPEGPLVSPQWRAPMVDQPVANEVQLAHWWRVFNDADLSALIQQALVSHTSVRSAQAALAQARAQRDASAASLLPAVRASGSVQRAQAGEAAPATVFRAGLDASWEADVFGVRRHALSAADADLTASTAQLGQARISLAAEVALTYLDWRAQQQRLRVAQDNLALQESALYITQWRWQAGLASQLDVDQSLTVVGQTRAAIPVLAAAAQQSRNALAVLTGQPPQADLAVSTSAPVPIAERTLAVAIPADTLRQRPDVQAAEARLQAATARVAQAHAARLPSLSLAGSLDWRSPRVSDLFDVAALTRALVASWTASIWDGGALAAQQRVQAASLEQVRVSLDATVLTALQEVEAALLALQASQQRLYHLTAVAAAAANAEALARHRLASGLIDVQTLLDTQRSRLNSESELVSARASWSADHVRLYKALGGGWTPDTLQHDRNTPP